MTFGGGLLLLLVAGICGALGQSLSGYTRGGCLLAIFLGFVGAWLGLYLAAELGLPKIFDITIGGESFPIVWSVIGAALISLVFGLFSRSTRRR